MKPKTSNVAKLQSLKLGVSSFVPSLNASISTGSSSRCGYRNRRNSFVVRAEAEAEAESEPETSNVVAEEEEDIVEQEAEEVKPPRKPIVKLGDIMGVISCFNLHYGFFYR